MFCWNCGSKIEDGGTVCSLCGTVVHKESVDETAVRAQVRDAAKIAAKVENTSVDMGGVGTEALFLLFVNPVSYIVSGLKRHAARKALKEGRLDDARALAASAWRWGLFGVLLGLLIWGFALYVVYKTMIKR